MAGSRPTIRNVADRAGVSKSLVSLVMRGAPQVSEKRRQAVLEAARELGYRPNAVARSLVEGRTHLVGALVADLRLPLCPEILAGLQESLRSESLRLLISSGSWDPVLVAEAIEAFLELRVDALVLLGPVISDEAFRDAADGAATVVISPEIGEIAGPAVDTILCGDILRLGAEDGLPEATLQELREHGRTIGHMAGTLLCERIAAPGISPRTRYLAPRLQERASSSPAPHQV